MEKEWVYKNKDILGSLCSVLFQLWNILEREWIYKNKSVPSSVCTVLFQLWGENEYIRTRMYLVHCVLFYFSFGTSWRENGYMRMRMYLVHWVLF